MPANPAPKPIVTLLSALWGSGGLLWAIGAAGVTSLVWGMTTLAGIQSSIAMIEAQKVDAAEVRAILDRESEGEGNNIRAAIEGINMHSSEIDSRLRKIEVALSRLSTLVEERVDR